MPKRHLRVLIKTTPRADHSAGPAEGQYQARLDIPGAVGASTVMVSYTGVLDDRAQRLIAGALTLLDPPAPPSAATASA